MQQRTAGRTGTLGHGSKDNASVQELHSLATEQLGCRLNALQQINRQEQKTMYDTVYVIIGHIWPLHDLF